MLLPRTVPIAGVMAALGVPALTPAPPAPVDAVPVLTSTPFGAGPGQQVTHTITLSGTGTGVVAAVRVTFTTTVDLDGATASASPGRCAVTARTVRCDLGDLRFHVETATPTITITGVVHLETAPGSLVQNTVSVDAAQSAANPDDEAVSNAYLVSGSSATPTSTPIAETQGEATRPQPTPRPAHRAAAITLVLAGAAAASGLILAWRRRQRRWTAATRPGTRL